MALSFATIRFFAVIRHTVKVPVLIAWPMSVLGSGRFDRPSHGRSWPLVRAPAEGIHHECSDAILLVGVEAAQPPHQSPSAPYFGGTTAQTVLPWNSWV